MGFDFNNETALGTNRAHILDLIVLGRRDEWLNTYQRYRKAVLQNSAEVDSLFCSLRAILETLEFELRETFKRRLKSGKPVTYDQFKDLVYNCDSEDDLVKAFNIFNGVLDGLQITRIDNRKNVDSTDIEAVNISKGL